MAGLNNLGLGFVFRATDMASPVMRKVEGRFKKLDGTTAAAGASMTKHMAGVATGLGVAAVGAVGLAIAFKSASAFGEFDAALAKVQGRLGASADDMKILEDRAKRAGLETEFSPVEAVQGLEELTSKGLNATDAATALGGALNLAAAGQISVSAAANTVSAAMNVFGIEAAKAGEVADKLLKVTSLTALSAGDMELAMGNLGRGVSQTGQKFEDMLVLTGLVKNTGVDVSVAASSISSSLLALGKNAKQFRKLGIEVTDAKGEFKSLQEVMVDAEKVLAERFPDAADRAAGGLKLFTKFGLTSFGAVMKQVNTGLKDQNGNVIKGAAAIANYIERVKGAKGMGDAARSAKEDTLPGQMKLLQGSLQTLAIEFGRAFSDVFKPIVKGIKNFVNVLIEAMAAIPGPVKKVIAGLFVMVSIILVVAGVVLMLVSAVGLLKLAFVAFMPPIGALAVGIGIAAAAILGLVAVFKAVKMGFDENIGGFGDAVKEVFGKVKLYFGAVSQLMSGGNLRGGVLKKLLEPANKGVMRMVQRFVQAKHRVQAFFRGLKEGFQNVIKSAEPTFTALKSAFKSLATAFGFGSTAMELMTSSSGTFASAGESVGDVIARVLVVAIDILTAGIHMLVGAISIAKVVWEVLKPVLMGVGAVFVGIVKIFGGLISLFNIFLPVGDSAGFVWNAIGIAIAGATAKMLLLSKATKAWMFLQKAGRVINVLATETMLAFSGASAAGSMAILGPIGIAAAAIAAGYAFGQWLDKDGGWTDKLFGFNKQLYKTEEELNALGQTGKRGAPKVGDMDAVAAQRGMTTSKFIDVRSGELSQEGFAQDKGLTKEVIAARMAEGGGDYMRDLSKIEMQKFGISGITSKQDGKLAEGDSQKNDLREAVVGGLDEHATKQRSKRGKMKHTTIVKVGDTEIARQNQEGEAALSAFNFETLGE